MLMFCKNDANISKTKEVLVLKGIFSKPKYVCVYLRTKFQVSSIILTSFRQGEGFYPPTPQNEPLKSPPRLGLMLVIKKVAK